MKRIFVILTAGVLIFSCAKNVPDSSRKDCGSAIQFSISDKIELKSAGVETMSDLIYNSTSNPNAHVYLYATKGGSNFDSGTDPLTYDYTNRELKYDPATSLWDIESLRTSWEVDSLKNGYQYDFSAYAVRGTHISNVTVSDAKNFGKSFTVLQGADYGDNCSSDYLLSNVCSIISTWNGTAARGGLVNLHMEHALASVRVKVVVNENIYRVGIQGIQIKNFYRGATMVCTSQEAYGSGKSNKWTTTSPNNNGTDYHVGDVTKGSGNSRKTIDACTGMIMMKKDAEHQKIIMDFIAVPQDVYNAELTIAYLVEEEDGGSAHQVVSTWALNNYSGWSYGCRNLYTINIDTSNSLESIIEDWRENNTITGVIVP